MDANPVDRILEMLRPYAANWSGTLGRGDLVIPQKAIPHLIEEIIDAVRTATGHTSELGETELFHVLRALQTLPSLQDQATALLQSYRMIRR